MKQSDQTRIRVAADGISAVLNTLNSERFSFALVAFKKETGGIINSALVSEGDPRVIVEALEAGILELKAESPELFI